MYLMNCHNDINVAKIFYLLSPFCGMDEKQGVWYTKFKLSPLLLTECGLPRGSREHRSEAARFRGRPSGHSNCKGQRSAYFYV